jgi:hypothetical protein
MLWFKSPWYYWHTGQRPVALASLLLSTLVMAGLVVVFSGLSVWAVAVSLLLDSVGLALLLVYIFVIRCYLPDLAIGPLDSFVSTELVLPLLLGIVITRTVTLGVARVMGSHAMGAATGRRIAPLV